MSKNKVKFQLLIGTAMVSGLGFTGNSFAQMPSLPSVEVHLDVLETLKHTKEFSLNPPKTEEIEEVQIVQPEKISGKSEKKVAQKSKKEKNIAKAKTSGKKTASHKKPSEKKVASKEKVLAKVKPAPKPQHETKEAKKPERAEKILRITEKPPVPANLASPAPQLEKKAEPKAEPLVAEKIIDKKQEKLVEKTPEKTPEPEIKHDLFVVEKNEKPAESNQAITEGVQTTNARPSKVVPLEFLPPVKQETGGASSFFSNLFGSDPQTAETPSRDVKVADIPATTEKQEEAKKDETKTEPVKEAEIKQPAAPIKLKTTVTQKIKQPVVDKGVPLPVEHSVAIKKDVGDLLKSEETEQQAENIQPENPEELRGKTLPIMEADKTPEDDDSNIIPHTKDDKEQKVLAFKLKEQPKEEPKAEPRRVEVIPLKDLKPNEDEEVENAYKETTKTSHIENKKPAASSVSEEETEEYAEDDMVEAEESPKSKEVSKELKAETVTAPASITKEAAKEPAPAIPDLANVVEITPKQIDEVNNAEKPVEKPAISAPSENKKVTVLPVIVTPKNSEQPVAENNEEKTEKKGSLLSSIMKWMPGSSKKEEAAVAVAVKPAEPEISAPKMDEQQPVELFSNSLEKVEEPAAAEQPKEEVSKEDQESIAKAQLQIASINEKQAAEIEAEEKPVAKKVDLTLSLNFKGSEVDISSGDREKLSDFVHEILSTESNIVIKSYAKGQNGEINSARRTSLKRAIEIRSQMITDGLDASRITVQAVGSEGTKSPRDSADIYLTN